MVESLKTIALGSEGEKKRGSSGVTFVSFLQLRLNKIIMEIRRENAAEVFSCFIKIG